MDTGDMSGTITVIVFPNRFRLNERQIHQLKYIGQTLEELKAQFVPDKRVSIAINDMPIERQFWDTAIARPNDYISIFPYVGKGQNEKMVMSAVAMIALAMVAPGLGNLAVGAEWGAKMTLVSGIAAMGIAVGGGLLISSINADYIESKQDKMSMSDMQQSYGWNPQTTQQQDIPKAICFGKRRVYGNVICSWTELNSDGTSEIANVIIGICKGPIKSISEDWINEQPLGNFGDIEVEKRLGNIDQTALTLFDGIEKLEFRRPILVSSASAITVPTSDDDYDDLEVTLYFTGVYELSPSKGMLNHSIGVKVEVSEHDMGSWTIIGQETVTRNKVGGYYVRYVASDSMTITRGKKHDIRVTKTTSDVDDENVGDDVYMQNYLEVYTDGFRHPGLAHVGIKALAGERLSGSLNYSCIVEGLIVPTHNGNSRSITKITKASSGALTIGAGHGFSVDEYALISGVRGMTQINNMVGRVTAIDATTITVNIDTTNFSSYSGGGGIYELNLEYSNCPAWVNFFLATAPVISGDGAGTPYEVVRFDRLLPDRPDKQSLYNMAQFCDSMVDDGMEGTEKRITWNGGWESLINIWDAICEVCDYCRSNAVWNGTELNFIVDEPRSAVNTHSIGSLERDSFRIYSLKSKESSGKILLDYYDEKRDYKRTSYKVPNRNAGPSINEVRKTLRGCTKQSEGDRYGNYRMSQVVNIKNGYQWGASVGAIPYEIGDVINVQHDIKNVGMIGEGTDSYNGGGLVAAVDLTGADDVIILDRDISGALDGGETYEIYIRLSDDTTECKTVKSWSGREITIDGSFAGKPRKGDVWALGLEGQAVEKVAIVNMVRTQKNHFTIVAVDYYGHDEDDYTPLLPAPNAYSPSGQSFSIIRPPTFYEVKKRLPADALGIPNIDMPFTHNCQWNDNTPSAGYVSWSAEDAVNAILFCLKGAIYAITPGSSNKKYIYWDENYTTSFQSSDNENDVLGSGKRPVCINDSGTAYPCVGIPILHAHIIRTKSIYAEKYAETRDNYACHFEDSLDFTHSFECPFEIIPEMVSIISVKLSFKILPYRAYSTAAASGGGGTETSDPNGGFFGWYTEKSESGVSIDSTDLGSHSHAAWGHSHQVEGGTETEDCGGGNHSHEIDRYGCGTLESEADLKNTDLGSHSHSINEPYGGGHSHDIGNISDHTHDVTFEAHSHDTVYGIHEESNSPTIHYHINNGGGYGAPSGDFNSDQTDIDITSQISGAGMKGIRFDTDLRCRVAAIIMCKLDITA